MGSCLNIFTIEPKELSADDPFDDCDAGALVVVEAAVAGGVTAPGDVGGCGGRGDPVPDRGRRGCCRVRVGRFAKKVSIPRIGVPRVCSDALETSSLKVGL